MGCARLGWLRKQYENRVQRRVQWYVYFEFEFCVCRSEVDKMRWISFGHQPFVELVAVTFLFVVGICHLIILIVCLVYHYLHSFYLLFFCVYCLECFNLVLLCYKFLVKYINLVMNFLGLCQLDL